MRDDEASDGYRQLRTNADWCIVDAAIKVPDSVTDEHAVLLAAMECHAMALEKCGQELRKPDAVAVLEATLKAGKTTAPTLAELCIAGFVVQSTPGRSSIGPRLHLLKELSLYVNLDWLFGHSVVWFFR